MSVTTYKELAHHVGHEIVVVRYGNESASVECETCNEVLYSEDAYDKEVRHLWDRINEARP